MLVVTRHAWPLLTRLVGQGQRGQRKRSLVLRTRPINYPMLPSYLAVEMLETGRLILSQLCYFGPTRQSRTSRPGILWETWETLGDFGRRLCSSKCPNVEPGWRISWDSDSLSVITTYLDLLVADGH